MGRGCWSGEIDSGRTFPAGLRWDAGCRSGLGRAGRRWRPTPDACLSARWRLCAHPGELALRVRTTHPAWADADPEAGEEAEVRSMMYRICIRGRLTERLGSALEGMRLE